MLRRSFKLTQRCTIIKRNYIGTAVNSQAQALQTKPENEEYDEVARYPEIIDTSFTNRKKLEALSWQKQIQETPTVEEKMIKINMPRYYGFKVVHMNDERLPYNCLPAIQHYTRTLYEAMPTEMEKDENILKHVEVLKGDVQSALEFSHDFFR